MDILASCQKRENKGEVQKVNERHNQKGGQEKYTGGIVDAPVNICAQNQSDCGKKQPDKGSLFKVQGKGFPEGSEGITLLIPHKL